MYSVPLIYVVVMQSAIDERQENMISKIRRNAQKHSTDHTMQVSETELQISSLEADLKDMKRYIQQTHSSLVCTPASLVPFGS